MPRLAEPETTVMDTFALPEGQTPISREACSHFPKGSRFLFRAVARGALEEGGAVVGLMMLPIGKVKYDDAGRTVEIEVR